MSQDRPLDDLDHLNTMGLFGKFLFRKFAGRLFVLCMHSIYINYSCISLNRYVAMETRSSLCFHFVSCGFSMMEGILSGCWGLGIFCFHWAFWLVGEKVCKNSCILLKVIVFMWCFRQRFLVKHGLDYTEAIKTIIPRTTPVVWKLCPRACYIMYKIYIYMHMYHFLDISWTNGINEWNFQSIGATLRVVGRNNQKGSFQVKYLCCFCHHKVCI